MLRRLPFPLLALWLTAAILGTAWALVSAPFQAPDENAHFSYVEYLARTGDLPGTPGLPPFSTEQREAGLASNSDQVAGNPAAKMAWDPDAWEAWQRRDRQLGDALRADSGGEVSSSANPPLYYLFEALPAKLTAGNNLFTRLAWERLASVVWSLVLIGFAWLLAGEVFARDRQLQFVAAGVAGLLPMVQFVSASVTPDAMLFAAWAAVFWAGTVILRRGLTPRRAAVFLAFVGASCVVKATSYALLPGTLFVLGLGAWRMRAAGSKALLRLLGAGAALVLTLGVWFYVAGRSGRAAAAQVTDAANAGTFHLRDALGYLWQYYLPRVFGMDRYPFPGYVDGVPFWDIVMRGVFGTYGWTEVKLPQGLFLALLGVLGAIVAAVVRGVVAFRERVDTAVLGFFLITLASLWVGLQWTDYNILRDSDYQTSFNQGRYLLPMMPVAGLGVALATWQVAARHRLTAIAVVILGLVALNAYSLGLTAWRFYA